MNNASIQLQDKTGNWVSYSSVVNTSQMVVMAMRNLSSRYPGYRVRAVDKNGRLIDIL